MAKSSFVTPLITELIGGNKWRLHFQFAYERWCKGSTDVLTVPAGFVFDFASIPKFLMVFLPWWAKFNKAPVLHDYLYQYGEQVYAYMNREVADQIFYEAMLVAFRHHRSGKFVAFIEYWAVRIFGFLSYKRKG